eukprot:403345326
MNSLQSKLKKSLNSSLLGLVGWVGLIQACSYNEYYYNSYTQYSYSNYDVCTGNYCTDNIYCESGNCDDNVCSQPIAAWAIFLITFFSVFFFILIIRSIVVCCRRKRATLIIQANAHPQHNNHAHHHHHIPEAQRLIVTHQQIPTGVPQPLYNAQPNYAAQHAQYGMPLNQGYGQPIYHQQPQPVYGQPQPQNNMYLPPTSDQQPQYMPYVQPQQQPATYM